MSDGVLLGQLVSPLPPLHGQGVLQHEKCRRPFSILFRFDNRARSWTVTLVLRYGFILSMPFDVLNTSLRLFNGGQAQQQSEQRQHHRRYYLYVVLSV
ncbi:hypothetical protein OUZ56_000695 [Daphnia magna]|uniref:Uncharacterized protein n=1 Tax=Daphnia magna TaxID=35525 RepID=A0ABR0A0I9_9CRUS|nr:hypothetical protein OUZ56_000695 [Daphnia magna]